MASSRTRASAAVRLSTADDLLDLVDGAERYIDCCIIFRRESDKAYLFEVGGRWDTLEERYTEDPPETAVYVNVDGSQLELAAAFWEWLQKRRANDPDRDLVIFAGGERGGGKTFFSTLMLVAVALEVPGCLCWAVSPTIDKREEIERTIRDWVPLAWRSPPFGGYRGIPDCRFMFPMGSAVRSLSSETLGKRGEAECVFVNEAQDHPEEVFGHGLPPLRKAGGLMILAGNAPAEDNDAGAWTVEAREGIEEGAFRGSYCHVDASLNSHINQGAQDEIGRAMYRVVPRMAAADVGDEWKHPGRRAFPTFRPYSMAVLKDDLAGHVGDPPDIGCDWLDITRKVTLERAKTACDWVVGVDFGKVPHNAVVFGKVLQRRDGATLYYFSDELLVPGSENDLAEAMVDWCDEREIDRSTMLLVADGSGKWQKTSRERDGLYSHDILKSYGGWTVVPPRKPANPKNAPSGAGRNPHVPDSLSQIRDVAAADRILVGSRARWLVESLKKAAIKKLAGGIELNKDRDWDKFTHVTDAVRYVVWFLEPRRKPQRSNLPFDGDTYDRLRALKLFTTE